LSYFNQNLIKFIILFHFSLLRGSSRQVDSSERCSKCSGRSTRRA
jgi:hypothetical protein